MSITSSADYHRGLLLSQNKIESVILSSPLLAFTVPVAGDIPNSYSGMASFLVQPPFVSMPGGLISNDRFMDEKDGVHTVKQKTMRIDFKRVSGAAEISHDDVRFLFNLDQFPANVPTNTSSFYERGDRAYRELMQQITRQINDHQFKTVASRGFICAGSVEESMYDCIEGHVRTLVDYMIRINGGVLQNARLKGSMPNSAIGVLRAKSGLNYTQALRSEMFLSDTKNMLSALVFDSFDVHVDTSTYFHQAGKASKADNLVLEKIDKEMDEYHTMTVTFSGAPKESPSPKEQAPATSKFFRKGDIIQLKNKEWLARDRIGMPSGVPIALTVMEDTDEKTVRVSPGITYGVEVPDENYLKGAKAVVVPDHCKAFFWWQPALMFRMLSVPKPSSGKYLYKEISAPNAGFGPTRNISMSFLVESHFVFSRYPKEFGELMAIMCGDGFPFFIGTLILPPKSPKPEIYIKVTKNLS